MPLELCQYKKKKHQLCFGFFGVKHVLEHFYGNVPNSLCKLCGKENEDTYHILFKCPHYAIERQKYVFKLSNYAATLNDNNYLILFNNLSTNDALSLFYFFNCSLTRRKLYLEDTEQFV